MGLPSQTQLLLAAACQTPDTHPNVDPDLTAGCTGSNCKIAVLLVALLCVACGLFGQPWSLTCLARKAGLLPYLREAHARLGTLSWLSSRPGALREWGPGLTRHVIEGTILLSVTKWALFGPERCACRLDQRGSRDAYALSSRSGAGASLNTAHHWRMQVTSSLHTKPDRACVCRTRARSPVPSSPEDPAGPPKAGAGAGTGAPQAPNSQTQAACRASCPANRAGQRWQPPPGPSIGSSRLGSRAQRVQLGVECRGGG